MMLLIVGFAVGVLAAFLLRLLIQIEKDGMANMATDVSRLVELVEHLEKRVETLEAIVAADDLRTPRSPDLASAGGSDQTRSIQEEPNGIAGRMQR